MNSSISNTDEHRFSRRLNSLLSEGEYLKKSTLSFDTPTDIDSQTHTYPSDIDDDSCDFTLPSLPYSSSYCYYSSDCFCRDGIIKVCTMIRTDMRSAPISDEQKLYLRQGLLCRGCRIDMK